MQGKYSSRLLYWMYKLYRSARRFQISSLVSWDPIDRQPPLDPGCTVLLGMCSQLPAVIYPNLACLQRCAWDDLRSVYIVVDCRERDLAPGTEAAIVQAFPSLNISFFYYSERQRRQAEKLKLPYLYSWMSWCIGLKHTTTQTVLIHDYDALVLSPSVLKRRYDEFQRASAKIQGIEWYSNNGFVHSDRLACTFEAFVDVEWLRSFRPVDLFNNMGIYQGRSVDYDTTLEVQALHLDPSARTISPMSQERSEIVHPSQMIHQYTMFRKFPARSLPCYSMILLPLFDYLAGKSAAFTEAKASISRQGIFTWDSVAINLEQLEDHHLHWGLQQSVQTLMAFDISPLKDFFDYYQTLANIVGCSLNSIEHEHTTPDQQDWFASARKTQWRSLPSGESLTLNSSP